MRILHVDTERGWRGGEQQLLYLVEGLREKGIGVAVACRAGEELEKRCEERGIETIPLKGNSLTDILRIGAAAKRFDIVHAHSAKAHTISAFSKKFHRKPVIYTRRVDYPPRRNSLTSLKYRLTDEVVAISKAVAEIVSSNTGIPVDRIPVIPSAVEPDIERKVRNEAVERIRKEFDGKPLIGTAAALTEQKNIPNLIEAARILTEKYPEAKFVVFGEGKLRQELERLIEEKGLKGNFILAGFRKNIEECIKALDLFVLPSDFEGLGSSILIAMALKVPVVATDVGGVSEAVINGETGLLVPRGNPVKLAHAISRVLEDKTLQKHVVSRAFNLINRKFSVDRMVDAYTQLYGEVVGGRSIMGKVP